MSTMRAGSDLGVMSPKPTVEKAVTVKYKAPVRVSGWVKFAAEARSITKYVEANTRSLADSPTSSTSPLYCPYAAAETQLTIRIAFPSPQGVIAVLQGRGRPQGPP